MKTGDRFYLAHPDSVEAVTFVENGDGGRIFKRRKYDPVVVRNDSEDFVVERESLYSDALAASIASAELARKLADTL